MKFAIFAFDPSKDLSPVLRPLFSTESPETYQDAVILLRTLQKDSEDAAAVGHRAKPVIVVSIDEVVFAEHRAEFKQKYGRDMQMIRPMEQFPSANALSARLGFRYNDISLKLSKARTFKEDTAVSKGVSVMYLDDFARVEKDEAETRRHQCQGCGDMTLESDAQALKHDPETELWSCLCPTCYVPDPAATPTIQPRLVTPKGASQSFLPTGDVSTTFERPTTPIPRNLYAPAQSEKHPLISDNSLIQNADETPLTQY